MMTPSPSVPHRDRVADRRLSAGLIALLLLLNASGCATFQPTPFEEVDFKARTQTQSNDDLTVSVAVLSAEESERVFGVPLDSHGIQPVWLRIVNRSTHDYLFVPAGMDPDYFSPQEVVWANRSRFSAEGRRAMEAHFDRHSMRTYVPRGGSVEGFVHTNRDQGVKYLSVQLFRLGGSQQFDFVVGVPGFEADYHRVDWAAVVPPGSERNVDREELRALLAKLPCCVLGPDRATPGDPLNIVVIGPEGKTFPAFARRGWDATETITSGAVWRTIASSLFGSSYEVSPVSPLFYAGRSQDIALQKARGTVDERNHMRLWLTPYRLDGRSVWVGQISRDIGVRLSSKTLVTHKIDPDVDEARDYLLQDLLLSGNLAGFGYVEGVGLAAPDVPRHNFTLDPYFTDGLRLVLILDGQYVPADRLQMMGWETPVKTPRDELGRPIDEAAAEPPVSRP
jgi:LssY C-terminus